MKSLFYYVICLVAISSCKQDLCEYNILSDNQKVQVTVDWSQSNIDQSNIHNVSLYAYPEDGGSPYLRVSGNVESAYIYLPAGVYNLLLINDVVGDMSGVTFYNSESYSDFHAKIIGQSTISNPYYDVEEGEVLAPELDQIAAWHMEGFEVLPLEDCVYCEDVEGSETLLDASPTPITTQCIFTIRVENLNNAQSIKGVVRGFAAGAYLSSGERISTADAVNIYSIDFTSAQYDDDNINGVIDSEIITFGKEPDESQIYELELDVVLNSGELITFDRDITEQVKVQDNLKIFISLELSDNMIVLPEGNGTGFGVEAWGERETIELF